MAKNVFAEILDWSAGLTPWQNEAIRRICRSASLSVADEDEIFKHAMIEHGLAPAPAEQVDLMLKATELPTPPAPGQRVQLNRIRELANINALRGDPLTVGRQLTIVYGGNASGKSGYTRVMKKAFRALVVDPILQDVHSPNNVPGAASAVFEIEEGGKPLDVPWADGKQSAGCLGRFAVFDSKCARAYLSSSNELAFRPYGLEIVDRLATMTDEAKKRFLELARTAAPKPEALKFLIDETSVGKFLGGLTGAANESDIISMAIWEPTDEALLVAREAEFAYSKANSPSSIREALASQRRRIKAIRDELEKTEHAISDEKVTEIKDEARKVSQYEAAVAASARLAFGDLDLPGIGGDVWRELLIAASAYSTREAYPGQPYPATVQGVKCVLCLQPLDSAARARLKGFWDFIQDTTSTKLDEARKALAVEQGALADLPKALPKHIEILEDSMKGRGSVVFEAAKTYYAGVAGRIGAIESAITTDSWTSPIPTLVSVLPACDHEISDIDGRFAAIEDDLKATVAIQVLSREVAELAARKRLAANSSLAIDHLRALKRSGAAARAAGTITTNAISLKARDLQTKYATKEFKTLVKTELESLGVPTIRAGVDKRSEKGRVLHRVIIAGVEHVSPDLVFSEGERTAISLACFLAELANTEDNCGIVLDDPVTSLDHRIRPRVAERLVKEALGRQVIIFTHDMVFYRELQAAAERLGVDVKVQNVEALGATVGILSDVPPWEVMKVGARIAKLEGILKQAIEAEAACDPAGYRQAFREFYDRLRATWERSVEELLFNGVIQRLEEDVRTKKLTGVQVDDPAVEAVFQGMDRTSAMIDAHDHAVSLNSHLPSSGELTKDIGVLTQFYTQQKKKRQEAESRLAHLK